MTVKQLIGRLSTCDENATICLDLFMNDNNGHTEEIDTDENAIVSVVTNKDRVYITFEC